MNKAENTVEVGDFAIYRVPNTSLYRIGSKTNYGQGIPPALEGMWTGSMDAMRHLEKWVKVNKESVTKKRRRRANGETAEPVEADTQDS